jgi:primosomal protein N' (replication factor Y) (superfamily II helicase)
MNCDVVFDLPRREPFSYAIPDGMTLRRGQRVSAPLHGRSRVGVVVAVRQGDAAGLKPVERPVESVPILSDAALALSRWAADESLSSWGSTLLALLPPLAGRRADVVAPPPEPRRGHAPPPELWIGASRDARLTERLTNQPGSALVIVPDRDRAAQWAARLDATRLDSGVPEAARRAAWFAASRGRARIVVGTRSALLTPFPPPAVMVLVDEHDPAHKPPGAPRLHSRDLLRERALLEGHPLLLLSAAPSVESWWRAESAEAIREEPDARGWPEVVTGDTRGILRNHPLTLPLTRAIEDSARRGRRVALIVTRRAAGVLCPECGRLLRCPDCGVPLAFSRGAKALGCRLCARAERSPERCPGCGGHKLSPFGWDAERVEAAVSKRFPRLTVSRTDAHAQVVVGPPAVLRKTVRGGLGCVGIVALDSLLGMPDFRGGERAFELAWTAAEAVAPGGRLIVQTLHPEHYAVQAVKERDRRRFYKHELHLRAELGYPPYRRLCLVSVRGRSESEARARIGECAVAVSGIRGLTVYPAAPAGGTASRWRFVIKGPDDLPRLLGPVLTRFLEQRRRAGAMLEVEMDPV